MYKFLLALGISYIDRDPREDRSWKWTMIPARAAKFPNYDDADDARQHIRNPIIRRDLEIKDESELTMIVGRVCHRKTPFHLPDGMSWAEHLYSSMTFGPAVQLN